MQTKNLPIVPTTDRSCSALLDPRPNEPADEPAEERNRKNACPAPKSIQSGRSSVNTRESRCDPCSSRSNQSACSLCFVRSCCVVGSSKRTGDVSLSLSLCMCICCVDRCIHTHTHTHVQCRYASLDSTSTSHGGNPVLPTFVVGRFARDSVPSAFASSPRWRSWWLASIPPPFPPRSPGPLSRPCASFGS